MVEAVFAEGISVFQPREGAPEFVIGDLVVDVNTLVNWVKNNKQHLGTDKKLRMVIKKSREGKVYADVNTFKPQKQAAPAVEEVDDIFAV